MRLKQLTWQTFLDVLNFIFYFKQKAYYILMRVIDELLDKKFLREGKIFELENFDSNLLVKFDLSFHNFTLIFNIMSQISM